MASVTVYLVGAGPGDVGLITVRGREVLARADVVVYDYLANPALLDFAPASAERIDVGKKGFERHVTQDEVDRLLIDAACALEPEGGTVVRLKGGDPFVFGRGGEEALALVRAGIAFEVVPGVTSGVAAPAYAGIPVTHRGVSSSVTFIAGNEDPAKSESALDWPALASLAAQGGTLCFYMGMRNLEAIVGNLMRAGAAPDTPVAVIQWGTAARQRTVVAKLGQMAAEVARAALAAPAIVLVGQVACLRDDLSWFERWPLFGRRVVVTRSRVQASSLAARLMRLGADVVEFPTIEIAEPDSYETLDEAIAHLGDYQWIVFTSVNGVDAFFARLHRAGCDARALGGARIAAIGPATARRLRDFGIAADAVPDEYRGEAVFDAIAAASSRSGVALAGANVLIPRAQEARKALPELLRGAGARVDVVAAYRTVVPSKARSDELVDKLEAGEVDVITFTSSSTARNLVALLGDRAGLLANVQLASIGPITSATLRELGFEPAVEAQEYTIDGLVDALRARADGIGPYVREGCVDNAECGGRVGNAIGS